MFAKAIVVGAFAALAAAQSSVLTFTRVPSPVTAGQQQVITYATNDTTTPVTIILRRGPSNNLQTISTLTTTAFGGQYVWTPSTSLSDDDDYALEIEQGTQINYFGPFSIQGGGQASSSSASASSSSSSASGSASSATSSAGATGGLIPSSTNSTTSSASLIGTGMASIGTGTSMSRNTTLSIATLTSTAVSTASTTTAGPTTAAAGTTPASPSTTGSSASSIGSGSALALVFGAVAAILCY